MVADHDARYPLILDPTISDADWQVWNPGLPGADGLIRALFFTSDANGSHLYVGGDFMVMVNVVARNIAHWNGSRRVQRN